VVVWRLDRWGRSLPDLVVTLRELIDLGVGFVSLNGALDLTTPTGRAMVGMLAVFAEFEREILRERVRAGTAQARKEGCSHGRPRTAILRANQVPRLKAEQVSHSEIARQLGIGRTSVRLRCVASWPPDDGRSCLRSGRADVKDGLHRTDTVESGDGFPVGRRQVAGDERDK
jgi:DNA invertase Pin-like site-specific DNA recombinase